MLEVKNDVSLVSANVCTENKMSLAVHSIIRDSSLREARSERCPRSLDWSGMNLIDTDSARKEIVQPRDHASWVPMDLRARWETSTNNVDHRQKLDTKCICQNPDDPVVHWQSWQWSAPEQDGTEHVSIKRDCHGTCLSHFEDVIEAAVHLRERPTTRLANGNTHRFEIAKRIMFKSPTYGGTYFREGLQKGREVERECQRAWTEGAGREHRNGARILGDHG